MVLNRQKSNLLNSQLQSGERIIWSGEPAQGLKFRSSDIFLIPFSLMWGGFAIVWETIALISFSKTGGAIGIIFPLFGIPFVIVGLYMIFGRFIVDNKNRKNTIYAVTNERIIIVSGLFKMSFKTLNLKNIGEYEYTFKRDGSGTITFGSGNNMSGFGKLFLNQNMRPAPSFEFIPDVKKVYDIINNTQKEPNFVPK